MRDLQRPGRSPVLAPNGMACTSHPLSTSAALDVLRRGGNAVDAALAAVAVQAVVEPASTGVGGDCFCLYAPANRDTPVALNGSGRAPQGLSAPWLLDNGITAIAQQSPHAVTIPTAVDAWVRLNQDYGSRPLAELLQPAIGYARDGYPIGQRVAFDFAANLALLKGDPDAAAVFLRDGRTLPMGARHTQPQLAQTLEQIAAHGRDGFYAGRVAADMLAKLRGLGGRQTQEDFDAAAATYVTPINSRFRDYEVWQCPPNGQGVIALLLLEIMAGVERFGAHPITVERIHHEIEAGRLAYRDRALYLADPDFSAVPVAALLDPAHGAQLRAAIHADRARDPLPDLTLPRHKSTVYIAVVDRDRNACSLINTLFYGFGSGLMAPQSGVLLHNRGMGFVVQPGHPNCIEPGKRPLHTIIPGMVTQNGNTVMPFGVMGGDYQAFGQMQLLTRMMDYGMDVQAAQDCPRFFPDPFSATVELETTIPPAIAAALRARGHAVAAAARPIGGAQAIWIDHAAGQLIGGSDPRKDGMAAGY